MPASLAVSSETASSSAIIRRCCSRISDRRIPRRRWVAATDTQVTPFAGTAAPPGIRTAKSYPPVAPTSSVPSWASTKFPGSNSSRP